MLWLIDSKRRLLLSHAYLGLSYQPLSEMASREFKMNSSDPVQCTYSTVARKERAENDREPACNFKKVTCHIQVRAHSYSVLWDRAFQSFHPSTHSNPFATVARCEPGPAVLRTEVIRKWWIAIFTNDHGDLHPSYRPHYTRHAAVAISSPLRKPDQHGARVWRCAEQ